MEKLFIEARISMKIIVCKDYQEMSHTAAKIVIEQVKHKPDSILGLATGSSPLGMYERIIKSYQEKEVSFKEVKTFNLDEYVGIDLNHKESYHFYMNEHLFKHIDINPTNIHIPSPNGNIKKTTQAYDYQLKNNPIDLQVLGLGTNGHIGFNEPGTPFSATTFKVELNPQTRTDNARFFNTLDEVPTHAITMGIKSIMKAKKILVLVYGSHKQEALYNMIYGEITPQIPASILQVHCDLTVITDEAALGNINPNNL